jgi:hypothetical protein
MQPRVQHLLETRFSVRLRLRRAPFSSAWLEERIALWRRFCLPSIAAQTGSEFTWLVLCDESTDPEAVAVLRSYERDVPALEVAMTAADCTPRDVVGARVRADTDVLITTWLDSDDAVADSFVESVQAYAEPFARSDHETLVVNFPRGYRFDVQAGSLYEEYMINSPFASLLERPRAGPVETVLNASHVMLPHLHLTQQDESHHAWLIGVHGGNLINRIGSNGRLASPLPDDIQRFPASALGSSWAGIENPDSPV